MAVSMQIRARWLLATSLLVGSAWPLFALSHGDEKHDDTLAVPSVVLAPGYEALLFPAPEPGSYELPALSAAGDGAVLDVDGNTTTLYEVFDGKLTVLSFVYASCNDVNGCPLATYVLHQIRQQLATSTSAGELGDNVQMVSMSFDPTVDTPDAMKAYASGFGPSPIDWHFLTAASTDAINPILEAYDQAISHTDGPTINHVLRVYLIDQSRTIRNIYSSQLLHADTLVADIRTLLLAETDLSEPAQTGTQETTPTTAAVTGKSPDARDGYAKGTYRSQSQTLLQSGQPADLHALATQQQLGLPAWQPAKNFSPKLIELGRQLFFDRRLSHNDTLSCAMCHVPAQGFTVHELRTAVGVEGRTVRRNAPTLLNARFLDRLFHDGREFTLEQQVWSPLLAHNEMANPSIGHILETISNDASYQRQFTDLFGTPRPHMQGLGQALAAYQASLVAGNAPFDQWLFGKQEQAINDAAKRGFALFTGKARCSTCHTMDKNFALFTDQAFHNTGIGYLQSQPRDTSPKAITLAPGVTVEVDPAIYADSAEKPPIDLGRYEITENPADRWTFRTAALRNVALTAPYMHDGSIATLTEVVAFYNAGGIENPLLSHLIKPLGLEAGEQADLVAFLESLTSDYVSVLAIDARTVRIGERQPRVALETDMPTNH